MGKPLEPEDAMMWLNDLCGQRVFLTLSTGGGHSTFLHTIGELRHWTATDHGGNSGADAGTYYVGECAFSISDPDLPHLRFRTSDPAEPFQFDPLVEGLEVSFTGSVVMRVYRIKEGED